jgi:hypothetical protein
MSCFHCHRTLPDIFVRESTGKSVEEELVFCNPSCQKGYYLTRRVGVAPMEPRVMMLHHTNGKIHKS